MAPENVAGLADSDQAWPCHSHSLVLDFRLVSKLLPPKAMTYLVEMFRKGNAAGICGDGKPYFWRYRHREYVLANFNVSSHNFDLRYIMKYHNICSSIQKHKHNIYNTFKPHSLNDLLQNEAYWYSAVVSTFTVGTNPY